MVWVGVQLEVHPLRLFDAWTVNFLHNCDLRVDMRNAPNLSIFYAVAQRKAVGW